MKDLQEAIEETVGQLAGAKQSASYSVILDTDEAQLLVDAAQLVAPLQERCQILGRALGAVWSLIGEDDQLEIMSLLPTPMASALVQLIQSKGAPSRTEVHSDSN